MERVKKVMVTRMIAKMKTNPGTLGKPSPDMVRSFFFFLFVNSKNAPCIC